MKQFKMPTAYAILTGLIVAVAIATWIIPAGQYDYVDGLPIAGSYHTVEANPQGIGAILLAPPLTMVWRRWCAKCVAGRNG